MASKDLSNNVSFQWHNSISRISKYNWNNIFGNSIIRGYDFFKISENCQFHAISFSYLEIYESKKTVAIVACFNYYLDINDLIHYKKANLLIKRIRLFVPNFLKINTFVVGSYPATCEHFIGISTEVNENNSCAINKIIQDEISKKSKMTKSSITLIKDIRERCISDVKMILGNKYEFYSAYPTNIVPISEELSPYPIALKKKNRNRYKKYKRLFDNNFTWDKISLDHNNIEHFTKLYLNVLEKASNKFEILNSSFFHILSDAIPQNVFLLIARDKTGCPKLMELVIDDNDRLLPLYLGIEYDTEEVKTLYINAIFKTIEEAGTRKKDLIEFGQTSYYPKVMSGAFVEDIYYGFTSHNRLVQYLIKRFFVKIFTPIKIPGNVYLLSYHSNALETLKKKDIKATLN